MFCDFHRLRRMSYPISGRSPEAMDIGKQLQRKQKIAKTQFLIS